MSGAFGSFARRSSVALFAISLTLAPSEPASRKISTMCVASMNCMHAIKLAYRPADFNRQCYMHRGKGKTYSVNALNQREERLMDRGGKLPACGYNLVRCSKDDRIGPQFFRLLDLGRVGSRAVERNIEGGIVQVKTGARGLGFVDLLDLVDGGAYHRM